MKSENRFEAAQSDQDAETRPALTGGAFSLALRLSPCDDSPVWGHIGVTKAPQNDRGPLQPAGHASTI